MCAARPCEALGGVVLLWLCPQAANRGEEPAAPRGSARLTAARSGQDEAGNGTVGRGARAGARLPFMGARGAVPWARTPRSNDRRRRGLRLAARSGFAGPHMGSGGPGAGRQLGRGGLGRAFGLGPGRKGVLFFFPKVFSSAK
jgi:hypothetical protein